MSMLMLQPELQAQLEFVAAERAMPPVELVEAALRIYLRQIEQEQIEREAAAFRAMHRELSTQFLGQYVAIHGGVVVDSAPDFQTLHSRVRQRYGRQPILLRRVEADAERTLTFRSPRFESGRS